jgi:non-heme chloroperoxidase
MFDSNIVEIISPILKNFTQKYPNIFETFWKTSYLNPLMRFIIYDGGFNRKFANEKFVELYMKKISELNKELFFHLLDEMKNHDILAFLNRIECPTLIVGGTKDKVIPNHLQYEIHKLIPKSELYIVYDGSHVPQVDFPDEINQRLQLFFQSV